MSLTIELDLNRLTADIIREQERGKVRQLVAKYFTQITAYLSQGFPLTAIYKGVLKQVNIKFEYSGFYKAYKAEEKSRMQKKEQRAEKQAEIVASIPQPQAAAPAPSPTPADPVQPGSSLATNSDPVRDPVPYPSDPVQPGSSITSNADPVPASAPAQPQKLELKEVWHTDDGYLVKVKNETRHLNVETCKIIDDIITDAENDFQTVSDKELARLKRAKREIKYLNCWKLY